MTEKKKDEGCCGTHGSEGPCCAGKKMIIGIVVLGLVFLAGIMFAKYCPLGQGVCPMSSHMVR